MLAFELRESAGYEVFLSTLGLQTTSAVLWRGTEVVRKERIMCERGLDVDAKFGGIPSPG